MKRAVLLLCIVMTTLLCYAQEERVVLKGVVLDAATKQPLPSASVSLSYTSDTLVIASFITAGNGYFGITKLDSGTYQLIISFKGFESFKKIFTLVHADSTIDLGALHLQKAYQTLSEVVVTDKTPVKVKGDTVTYNANAFDTRANATVNDLLKKLPGVQVNRDGGVRAQGQAVQKVYLDGKEYFSDDPALATMNLTADMIDKVEVFDDRSEQARFSGVDDGSRNKALNLKLKKEKRQSVSGKVNAGVGTGGEYSTGFRTNLFKGPAQLSLLGTSNNINRSGYSASSLADAGNQSNGITQRTSAGINYRNTWNKHLETNGSYFFSRAQTLNTRNVLRQTILPGATLFTNRVTDFNNTHANHRFNQKIVLSIDSFNSIVYTLSAAPQRSRSLSVDTLSDLIQDAAFGYKASDSRTSNTQVGRGYNWSNNLIWRRKFAKAGRTFSANLNHTRNQNLQDGFNLISSRFYDSTGMPYRQRSADLKTGNRNNAGAYTFTLSYTEPVAKNSMVELNYSNHQGRSTSERNNFSYNTTTRLYDELNDTLSNTFRQVTTFNRVGANFRQVHKKYNYQLGIALQQSLVAANNLSRKADIEQRYTNVIPTATISYQLAKNRSLRFNYLGRNNPPGVLQLQDVEDVSNFPFIRRGNPSLRQEFLHSMQLSYNFFNTGTFRNVFASVFYNSTSNKIVNALQYRGAEQVLTPVNVDGVFNLNGSFGYSFPINRMEGGSLSAATRVGYNRQAGFVNGALNMGNNLQVGEDINLGFNHNGNLDLNLQAAITYNRVTYTVQKEQNRSFLTHNYSFDGSFTFPGDIILSTTLDFTGYTGSEAGFNERYFMWNAGITKQVLKKKQGEITLSVNNLLNQDNSVMRNVYDNVIEDVQNRILKRFVLLSFSYHFSRTLNR